MTSTLERRRRLARVLAAVWLSASSLHCGETPGAANAPGGESTAGDTEPDTSSFPDAASAHVRASDDAGLRDASTNLRSDAGGSPTATGRDAGVAMALAPDAAHGDAATSADAAAAPDAACPHAGHVTYALERESQPSAAQQDAYAKIERAMMRAVGIYNCQTEITKQLRIQYDPGVQTADGNANGNIRFGAPSTFEHTRAMHEIAHTLGVGTSSRWSSMLRDGSFTGAKATAQLRAITGKADDVVHADSQHFWPYGLNYASEVKSDADLVAHCQMVVALRADLGL